MSVKKTGKHRSIYSKRVGILGICKYKDDYLILRINKNWKYCPGDWDFVMGTFLNANESPELNTVMNIRKHTGLNTRKIIKSFPIFKWFDNECNVLFVLYPFLVQVERKEIELSNKFCEGKWVKWNYILNYDRKEYLRNVIFHVADNHI